MITTHLLGPIATSCTGQCAAAARALHRLAHTGSALALVAMATLAGAQTAPTAEPRFDVLEYVIEGNSVLDTEQVERAVYPFLGEGKTVANVEEARAALEQAYRNAGYGTVLVDIPEQRVTTGVVVLNVTQAAVSRVRVTGSRYFSQDRILAQVPGVAVGQVPHFPSVSAQLAEVNRTAERRVTPLLRPGQAPGTTEVDLTVEDRLPLSGSLELNNRQSRDTQPTRLVASLRYANLWQRDHAVSLQVQTSPEDTSEVRVLSANYTIPDGDSSWSLSYIKSDSTVFSSVGSTTVLGRGEIFGVRRNLLLRRGEEVIGTAFFGVDHKDVEDTVINRASDGDAGFATPIAYLPFSAGFTRVASDEAGLWQFGASIVAAMRGAPGDQAQFSDKRYLARASFALLKFDLSREHKLGKDARLFGKLEAQVTDRPLIGNEQMSAGGADSVRGYMEAAAAGDYGVRGTLELGSGNLAGESWPGISGLRAHAFVDGAVLRIHSALPRQTPRFALLGTGFGLRLLGKPYGSLALDLGWPLKTLAPTERGDLRVHASASIAF